MGGPYEPSGKSPAVVECWYGLRTPRPPTPNFSRAFNFRFNMNPDEGCKQKQKTAFLGSEAKRFLHTIDEWKPSFGKIRGLSSSQS